jgi:hypothetical protein
MGGAPCPSRRRRERRRGGREGPKQGAAEGARKGKGTLRGEGSSQRTEVVHGRVVLGYAYAMKRSRCQVFYFVTAVRSGARTAQPTSNGHFAEKTFYLEKSCPRFINFTYEPLNFRENMFVVHDFTYEPLNFRKICLLSIIFQKRTSNFIIIYPKTQLSMNFTYEHVNI